MRSIRSVGAVLRDAVPVALVALLVFRTLQRTVADRYPVDSGSMQPTIFGRDGDGDVVLVDKLASSAALARHDLAVFAKPERPREQIVKRVIAFGDDPQSCWIDLRDGDLWLGPDPQRMQREVKDPLAMRDLRIPWTEWPSHCTEVRPLLRLPASAEPGPVELPPLAGPVDELRPLFGEAARRDRFERFDVELLPPGFLGTSQSVDSTYLDIHGRRGNEAAQPVRDAGMDLDLQGAPGELLLTLELRPEAWTFRWRPRDGRCELWRNGATIAEHTLRAPTGGPFRVEFGLLDHRLFLAIDGDATWSVELPADAHARDPGPTARPWPHTLLHVGAVDGTCALRRARVFHDIHYFHDRIPGLPGTREWPQLVPPGCAFLLGDNTANSVDSRSFGPVPLATFLGRPRCVLGPWPRRVWFPR